MDDKNAVLNSIMSAGLRRGLRGFQVLKSLAGGGHSLRIRGILSIQVVIFTAETILPLEAVHVLHCSSLDNVRPFGGLCAPMNQGSAYCSRASSFA